MPPRVCILIPTYKRMDFLVQAIESAQRQTYAGPIDIVVLDDQSPDDTAAAVAPFLSDPRVRYVCHPQNVGIAENWRIGIGLASSGDFFCLLHDDDTYEPTFVEKLVAPLAADPGRAFAFCDHWAMTDAGIRNPAKSDEISARFHRDGLPAGDVADLARTVMVDHAISIGATLFRRAIVDPSMVDPAARGAIDYWLFYQCLRSGGRAYYVPERLMNYRLHGGSMSGSMPLEMAPGQIYRLTAAVADPMLEPLWPTLREELQRVHEDHGLALISVGRPDEARRELAIALAGGHGSIRARIAWVAAHLGPLGRLGTLAIRVLKRVARAAGEARRPSPIRAAS